MPMKPEDVLRIIGRRPWRRHLRADQ